MEQAGSGWARPARPGQARLTGGVAVGMAAEDDLAGLGCLVIGDAAPAKRGVWIKHNTECTRQGCTVQATCYRRGMRAEAAARERQEGQAQAAQVVSPLSCNPASHATKGCLCPPPRWAVNVQMHARRRRGGQELGNISHARGRQQGERRRWRQAAAAAVAAQQPAPELRVFAGLQINRQQHPVGALRPEHSGLERHDHDHRFAKLMERGLQA